MFDNNNYNLPILDSIHGHHKRGAVQIISTFEGYVTFAVFNCTGLVMCEQTYAEVCVPLRIDDTLNLLLEAGCPLDHGPVCPFEREFFGRQLARYAAWSDRLLGVVQAEGRMVSPLGR